MNSNWPRLCLSSIVKNESARIQRMLASVAPYVSCWAIGDTGSTDGTEHVIGDFFGAHGIPGHLAYFPFENFGQARNCSLEHARTCGLSYDYLLLVDADMCLVVEDETFMDRLLPWDSLRMIQKSGISYWNARLLKAGVGARYVGVTHEFLDLDQGLQVGDVQGAHFIDYADGANRAGKFERDIALLEEDVVKNPTNHRSVFYLAQSQRDLSAASGDRELAATAAKTYMQRAEMGGWDEEGWYARLASSRISLSLGDAEAFVSKALTAYGTRPWRAEPLYELARYYRLSNLPCSADIFAAEAMKLKYPKGDLLFIEDDIYSSGAREEFSISANYSKDLGRKDQGFSVCDGLALDASASAGRRALARLNVAFYARPAAEEYPSFVAARVNFEPPDGYHPTNPCVANCSDGLWLMQRAVNYTIDPNGAYVMPPEDAGVVKTRNFLLKLNPDFSVASSVEVMRPVDAVAVPGALITGFEDSRLFEWRGEKWCTSTVLDLDGSAICRIVLAKINPQGGPMTDYEVLESGAGAVGNEKNWGPVVHGDSLAFVYKSNPLRLVWCKSSDEPLSDLREVHDPESPPDWDAPHLRGGTQAAPFDGGRLMCVHEVVYIGGKRCYLHRFVWFGRDKICASRPFTFLGLGIEFAAGMALSDDGSEIVVSFGVKDHESWLGVFDAEEVVGRLQPVSLRGSAGPLTDPRIGEFALSETNTAMKSAGSVSKAVAILKAANLPLHGDDEVKNWDNLLAVHYASEAITKNGPGRILDAGAGSGSAFLAGLRALGHRDLLAINTDHRGLPWFEGGAEWAYGDITDTKLEDSSVAFVACLSVIEHGVPVAPMLAETARILRPGGQVFISTDYWHAPVDTRGQMAFGAPIKVFSPEDIRELLRQAKTVGLELELELVDLGCLEPVVEWMGMRYTFLNVLLRKVAISA